MPTISHESDARMLLPTSEVAPGTVHDPLDDSISPASSGLIRVGGSSFCNIATLFWGFEPVVHDRGRSIG